MTHIDYQELDRVPELMTEFRHAVANMSPLKKLGTKQKKTGGSAKAGAPGTVVPAAGFVVHDVVPERAALAEYCRTTGLRLSDTLPVTYPYVIAFPLAIKVMNLPGFPFAAVGAVHLTNQIEQFAPIRVGQRLSLRVHAENPRAHRAGLLVDIVTEASIEEPGEADNEQVVWRQVSGFLAKGARAEGLPEAPRSGVSQAGEPTGNPALAKVTEADIAAYAQASGDKNPIHVSKLGAKAFGFPTVIAHGMWSAAHMLAQMEGRYPDRVRYAVEFAKPVRLPGRIACYADPAGPGSWSLQLRSASRPEIIHAVGSLESLG